MAWSIYARNLRADANAAMISKVSLHTDDPDPSNGLSYEWSDLNYSRQSPSYNAASGGVASLAAELTFNGPSEEEAAYVGLWDSSNNYLGGAARKDGDAKSNVAGQYSISVLSINAEGKITA